MARLFTALMNVHSLTAPAQRLPFTIVPRNSIITLSAAAAAVAAARRNGRAAILATVH